MRYYINRFLAMATVVLVGLGVGSDLAISQDSEQVPESSAEGGTMALFCTAVSPLSTKIRRVVGNIGEDKNGCLFPYWRGNAF